MFGDLDFELAVARVSFGRRSGVVRLSLGCRSAVARVSFGCCAGVARVLRGSFSLVSHMYIVGVERLTHLFRLKCVNFEIAVSGLVSRWRDSGGQGGAVSRWAGRRGF